jgi:hypothetical protein
VTAQVLTRSLRALERDGIVVRRYFPEVPPCVEYGLTDLGFTLCEPVGAIRAWAEKYGEAILTARQRFEHGKTGDEAGNPRGSAEQRLTVEHAQVFAVELQPDAVGVAEVEAVVHPAVGAQVLDAGPSRRRLAAANCSAETEMAMCWTPPMVSVNGGWSWPGKSRPQPVNQNSDTPLAGPAGGCGWHVRC